MAKKHETDLPVQNTTTVHKFICCNNADLVVVMVVASNFYGALHYKSSHIYALTPFGLEKLGIFFRSHHNTCTPNNQKNRKKKTNKLMQDRSANIPMLSVMPPSHHTHTPI